MPQIKILPSDLKNKIAAGEVIERPASIVKELIENAIDAASTDIRVDVLYGGKRLIRVSDNGTGMDKEDALLCFQRHATSKLVSEDDLFNIRTMGFRGEALPSIASVSKIRLTTGVKGSASGISVEIHGGDVREIKDSPSVGTTVEVRDLFFNLPARKKFLKTNSTELFHIIDTVTKEALSHWETAFSLASDNKEAIKLPIASGPRERIMQIYGEEFLDGLIEANAEAAMAEGIGMRSFVTKGDNFRNTRTHQFIFINKRPIKDQSISHAAYKAYEGILPRDKHPVFFIFLDIDPGKVDFNVHPTKREVRFEDKESVYHFVNSIIKETVKGERTEYVKQFTEIPETDYPKKYSETSSPPYSFPVPGDKTLVSENLEFAYRPQLPFIYLGETFLAVAGKGGLTLIDHHAAHERVLYEKFLKGIDLNSHQLLFPKQVKLSHKEYLVILENFRILRDFGLDMDDFGHGTIIVRSLPDILKDADMKGIISDMASCIAEGIPPDKSFKEALAARIACHSSVRGKEILNQEKLSGLLSDLEQTERPDQCPHGRPTRIFLSLDDLKKMFKRK
jgi:DNA mismatch repair protein MutL